MKEQMLKRYQLMSFQHPVERASIFHLEFKAIHHYDCFTSYNTRSNEPDAMISLVSEYLEEELSKYVEILKTADQISKRDSFRNREDEQN